MLEIGIPLVSITCLFTVTLYVTYSAVLLLLLKKHDDETNVNVYYLYGFAGANFFIDIFGAILFCYQKGDNSEDNSELSPSLLQNSSDTSSQSENGSTDSEVPIKSSLPTRNLNMKSAYAHVVGDTLRTLSLFMAAIMSDLFGIRGNVTDAWAAIIVSITIFILVIHMLIELYFASKKIT